jgi:hypothetical protein
VARYLSPGGQQFRNDRGDADPRLAALLAAYQAGQESEQAVLTALSAARLLVTVVAQKEGMVLPKLIGNDGRGAVLAFTCTQALARWRPDARPVPAEAERVWQAAVADGCAVVVDVAGPVPVAVEGARLEALANQQPVPPAHQDPDIRAAIEQAMAHETAIKGFTLAPSQQADLAITLIQQPESDAATQAAPHIAALLATRLRRGIEFRIAGASSVPPSP